MLRVMLWGWGVSINPISLGNTPPPSLLPASGGHGDIWGRGKEGNRRGARGVGGCRAVQPAAPVPSVGEEVPEGLASNRVPADPRGVGRGPSPWGAPRGWLRWRGEKKRAQQKPPEEKGSRGGYLSRGNKRQNGHFGNKRDKSRKIGGWVPSPPFFFPVPQAAEWAAGLAGAGAGRNWVTRSRLIAKVAGINTGARGWAHGEGSKRDGGSSPCPAQLWGRILPTHELWGHRPWAALVVGTPWGRRGEGPRPLQTTYPRSWREGAASSPAGPASPILLGS